MKEVAMGNALLSIEDVVDIVSERVKSTLITAAIEGLDWAASTWSDDAATEDEIETRLRNSAFKRMAGIVPRDTVERILQESKDMIIRALVDSSVFYSQDIINMASRSASRTIIMQRGTQC